MKTRPRFSPRRFVFLLFTTALILGSPGALLAGANVSLTVSPTQIEDQGGQAVFTFHASPPPSRRIAVGIAHGGTALPGIDYVLHGPVSRSGVVIQPGQTSVQVILQTYDMDGRFQKKASLILLNGQGYQVRRPSSATIRIDNIP